VRVGFQCSKWELFVNEQYDALLVVWFKRFESCLEDVPVDVLKIQQRPVVFLLQLFLVVRSRYCPSKIGQDIVADDLFTNT